MTDNDKPKPTVITKAEWHTEQFAAHLIGDDCGSVPAPALVPKQRPGKATILNPFHVRGVSGPIIDGEPKPKAEK